MKRIIMFSASFCAGCKSLKPLAEREAERHGVEFQYVDVETDDGAEMAEDFGIRSLPTLVCLKADGFELDRAVGNTAWKEIEGWMR